MAGPTVSVTHWVPVSMAGPTVSMTHWVPVSVASPTVSVTHWVPVSVAGPTVSVTHWVPVSMAGPTVSVTHWALGTRQLHWVLVSVSVQRSRSFLMTCCSVSCCCLMFRRVTLSGWLALVWAALSVFILSLIHI